MSWPERESAAPRYGRNASSVEALTRKPRSRWTRSAGSSSVQLRQRLAGHDAQIADLGGVALLEGIGRRSRLEGGTATAADLHLREEKPVNAGGRDPHYAAKADYVKLTPPDCSVDRRAMDAELCRDLVDCPEVRCSRPTHARSVAFAAFSACDFRKMSPDSSGAARVGRLIGWC